MALTNVTTYFKALVIMALLLCTILQTFLYFSALCLKDHSHILFSKPFSQLLPYLSLKNNKVIRALISNRLIALNKCSGVRPIGIGESLRHIIGKAICSATRLDLAVVCGTDQLCGGMKCGIEGAVHVVADLFEDNHSLPTGWGVLLVDASNVFNSLNRAALLWNVRILWPRCPVLFLIRIVAGHL